MHGCDKMRLSKFRDLFAITVYFVYVMTIKKFEIFKQVLHMLIHGIL